MTVPEVARLVRFWNRGKKGEQKKPAGVPSAAEMLALARRLNG